MSGSDPHHSHVDFPGLVRKGDVVVANDAATLQFFKRQ
jgi:hypothetical protein